MAKHLEAFDHVGLLVNKPRGKVEVLFIRSFDDFECTRQLSHIHILYGPINGKYYALMAALTSPHPPRLAQPLP